MVQKEINEKQAVIQAKMQDKLKEMMNIKLAGNVNDVDRKKSVLLQNMLENLK